MSRVKSLFQSRVVAGLLTEPPARPKVSPACGRPVGQPFRRGQETRAEPGENRIMRLTRRPDRRGVLLLIILGLLAMFGLVGMAFIVLTGQAKRGAIAAHAAEQRVDSPRENCDQAMMELLRGSKNRVSAARPHSLLEDMYGTGWAVWQITVSTTSCGGQLIEFPTPASVSEPWFYVGRVVTMLDGPAQGLSTHIVGYNPTSGALQIRAFREVLPSALSGPYRCLVNGPAFGGRGFGYTTGLTGTPGDIALRPGAEANATTNLGRANEDYDAVDHNNMALAMAVPLSMAWPAVSTGPVPVPIPSFQRSDLVSYWTAKGNMSDAAFARTVILRPIGQNMGISSPPHPDFTGSNPYFDPQWDGIYGSSTLHGNNARWDVDNDGDGIPDSVWIDLGFAVRSTPDGRLYKPLAAILCLDLDGRLNLNAHGSLVQAINSSAYQGNANPASDVPGAAAVFAGHSSPSESVQLPRGMGFGPAEINLLPVLNDDPTLYQQLLKGVSGTLDGRYGESNLAQAWPGVSNSSAANPLWLDRFFDYPDDYYYSNYPLTDGTTYKGPRGFGSPPDVKGLMCVGLDLRGQPLYAMMSGWAAAAGTANTANNPYQINLAPEAAHGVTTPSSTDNPFTAAELERILRATDVDAGLLPRRLYQLTYSGTLSNSILVLHRNEITTESWDAPWAPFAFNPANPDDAQMPRHVIELAKLKFNMPATATGSTLQLLQGRLLAWDLLSGLKMDLNRVWGNGKDDTLSGQPGYATVDEMEEAAASSSAQYEKVPLVDSNGVAMTTQPDLDHTNHINVNNDLGWNYLDKGLARQLFARHLYCLMMLVADLEYLDGKTGGRDATARLLAQWAINVADFRDRDSIMTPFEYDPSPFTNGWRCDNRLTTNDGITTPHVVWGCERPELLLTETLAIHDRRLEDLNTDSSGHKTTDTTSPDVDFDSRLRPRGSLFVELHNPWTALEPAPGELYASSASGYGVDLTKRAAGAAAGAPVWRMAITDYDDSVASDLPQPDLNDPDTTKRPAIERSVYFVDPGATLYSGETSSTQRYFPSTTTNIVPVLPGRYAIVGPNEPAPTSPNKPSAENTKATYLGVLDSFDPTGKSETDSSSPRQIALDPTVNPTGTCPITVQSNGSFDIPTSNIQNPVAVCIDKPRRLSISEPTGLGSNSYYPDTDTAAGGTGAYYDETSASYCGYQKPFNTPLDKTYNAALWDTIRKNEFTPHFRMIHLQRLANPLLAYNVDTNPYVTIDSLTVDLTSFNGIADDSIHADHGGGNMSGSSASHGWFVTRERGEHSDTTHSPNYNLWRHEPEATDPADRSAGTQTTYRLKHNLGHTLGFLNRKLNGDQLPRTTPAEYKGAPQSPFPWLTWLNRPFVSPAELLLVPADRPSQMLHRFRVPLAGATLDPYTMTTGDPFAWPTPDQVPFPHLLNFFQTGQTPSSTATTRTAPLFYRLLDFVRVPSPFIGTSVQITPANAVPGTHFFHPPFNHIPLFREPGRVNINTMSNPIVGAGLVNSFPGLWDMALWDRFVASRKGGTASGTSSEQTIQAAMLSINSSSPTRFARPFRSFFGAHLVPPGVTEGDEIDATILRREAATGAKALLEYSETAKACANTDQNPYFRYEALQRLGNLVTTRSNVYAVWVTIGYFEVTPNPGGIDDGHPDGYRLGRELGIDTGEVERHRAFYLFDRTIPVGFQRGEDLNVERAILLRRYIE
jgi:hypothetical protein